MRKIVIAVVAASLFLGFLFWRYSTSLPSKSETESKRVELIFWGLTEDEAFFRPLIQAYEVANPNIKIRYSQQSFLNYRTRIQTQLEAGQSADILTIHSSWQPMFVGDLSSLPNEVMSTDDFRKTFYPVVVNSLTYQGKIYGLPLEIDGLALFYNEDILSAANVSVPKTWQEFVDTARKVTVKNQQGQIQTAGAALGTTTNVDFWPEILGMLFLQQPKSNLASPASPEGAEVLQFYTNFVTDPQNKTWDTTSPSSTDMFTQGRLAFYFADARQAPKLKAANPNLHFKTAPVPQLPGGNTDLGGFWTEVVSAKSANQKQAWEFLKFLSSSQALQYLYQEEIQAQGFGQPYPRVDMKDSLVSDPVVGSFILQAPFYKAWYLNSNTQDAGINDEMIGYFKTAVDGVLNGQDPLGALQGIQGGVQQTLAKYKPAAELNKK